MVEDFEKLKRKIKDALEKVIDIGEKLAILEDTKREVIEEAGKKEKEEYEEERTERRKLLTKWW